MQIVMLSNHVLAKKSEKLTSEKLSKLANKKTNLAKNMNNKTIPIRHRRTFTCFGKKEIVLLSLIIFQI